MEPGTTAKSRNGRPRDPARNQQKGWRVALPDRTSGSAGGIETIGKHCAVRIAVTAGSWSDLVIGQALVHLQGRHRPTRPADDPGRHSCDCGAGRHVLV